MYKNPIEIIYDDIQYHIEDGIIKAVQGVGINVDKEELIKALKYDRHQYEKGYADAKAERKIGKWVDTNGKPLNPVDPKRDACWCSVCGKWLVGSEEYPVAHNFCPNCGAKMEQFEDC